MAAVTAKIKALCRQGKNLPLEALLRQLNSMLRGWTAYFRYGCSSKTFAYVRAYLWRRVFGWLRRKHPKTTWKELRRRFTNDGWWPADGEVVLFNPAKVGTRRYLYRGTKIPAPWPRGA
ncbi:group II intron maturase-specific domain-containing protein [Actinospica robiniae]|uniref:group II intron maturase-specific domain-containing protein n=1 Tax=Actinospica robiniae TaxID=304901 RepID=UPI0009FCB84F|nr:group II intron maturase-specific domain-containing protein [Actinospica robiniae]